MTPEEIMKVVLFFLTVAGSGWAIWWRIEGKVAENRKDIEKVAETLASHKLHVAEQYVSKAGLRETTDQIMEAISGVKAAVDNMTLRVDRIVENQSNSRTQNRS
ncbi:hypothetical protein [Rhizobium favelukesii]|uniref:Uncharacterized protein n=1 Tax=Rhizobium favelukesii TaxID=348824 RepID=W6RLT6_9HYPH|nr:hypothetical protein [Rhizobium favelukesii]MCS0463494.1 hypothetical protein [Rhizobium favelukesii]CDM59913.1 hypothetical protein LPU83_pLPU83a_0072 [Rhizobium favelukesii]